MASTLKILFFSTLRDIAGSASIELELSAGVGDVGAVLEALYERWPGLRDWDSRIRVAVDLEYVGREHPVVAGQEVAVMPPVQGG